VTAKIPLRERFRVFAFAGIPAAAVYFVALILIEVHGPNSHLLRVILRVAALLTYIALFAYLGMRLARSKA